jgi:hypothetical protein
MPDLWQECTCDDTLRCSLEDYKQLERKLEASAELSGHGFEIGGNHIEGINEIWMLAERMGSPDDLGQDFLSKLGAVIAKAGRRYWEFSYSNCASRPIVGESGGGSFRIYADGSIEYPRVMYPSEYDLRKLAIAILDDDHGISQHAHNALLDLSTFTNLSDILNKVEATDGRYYLPDGWDQ